MIKILLMSFAALTATAPLGVVVAQQPAAEEVEGLLDRIDDIERRRRSTRPESLDPGAAVEDAAATAESTSFGLGLVLWALGVAGFIFVAALAIRSYRGQPMLGEVSKALEVEDSIWVGRGQRILLIRARGQELLVGATGGTLTSLAVLSPNTPEPASAEARAEESAPPGTRDRDSNKANAKRFASLVQEELTNAAAGAPIRNKKQILQRLNSL